MRTILILILSIVILKPNVAISQVKLPAGLYKLDDTGGYSLTIDGKTYHANNEPIASLKNIKSISVVQDRFKKDLYDLNIDLDAAAAENLKRVDFFDYSKPHYIGIVIQGELVCAARWISPMSTGKITISGESKAKLEQIADRLKPLH